jgi:nucleoside transporter
MKTAVVSRLSIMMFLQYAIWGAWLPLFYNYLTGKVGLTGSQAGTLFAVSAVGAIFAPFIAGQIADRYFNTEKFLGISHLVGAALVWQLSQVENYSGLIIYGFLYSLVYAPTLSLTNSLAFHHIGDRDRDFGRVRVWGTVGWIIAGIGMGQWLLHKHSPPDPEATAEVVKATRLLGYADSLRLSAIVGIVMGIYCFTLPRTPPQPGKQKFAPFEALSEVKAQPLLSLFLIAFPISCVHQFYFVHTETFLSSLNLETPLINSIFGVGGGPMTIGQIAEILVLAAIPLVAKAVPRKTFLAIGLCAYILRFAIFAYVPDLTYFALALHGFCFGCFFFVAFMIVDEESSSDVRASAQSLFNLVVIGFGIIVGNYFAGWVAEIAASEAGTTDYALLFSIPMWITVACLAALLAFYPKKRHVTAGS